jgi:predicted GNAT superfamily acetyltransferase
MVGLLFGFVGRNRDGRFKHCSHQMGVLKEYRGRGVGEQLKARQRELVLAQGLDLVTWTYDPLENANAYLNIHKLGAVCRTYLRNVYGELRDALNQGLPTDRFEVDWWIGSERVARQLAGEWPRPITAIDYRVPLVNATSLTSAGWPEAAGWRQLAEGTVLVEVPTNFQQLKAADPRLARAWRSQTRAIFEHYFGAGYQAVDFGQTTDGDRRRSFYVLERES